MFQPLLGLGGADETSGAAADDVGLAALVDLAHGRAVAFGAGVGKCIGLGAGGTLRQHDLDDLRDDVAGALDDDGVADADVLAVDLVLVVQRGVGYDHAADGDGLELGDRRQRAGTADLDLDAAQDGSGLLGRELVRDRPARAARDKAEPLLQVEAVDLVDHAVDVVAQGRALQAGLAVVGEQLIGVAAARHARVHRQAPAPVGLAHAGLGVGGQARSVAPGVGEEAERAGGGDGRVELAQRAGGRIARIGEDPFAGRRLGLVQLTEIVVAEIDLAANIDRFGHVLAGEAMRNVLDGHDVGGDVLALGAVAPGCGLDEPPAVVA